MLSECCPGPQDGFWRNVSSYDLAAGKDEVRRKTTTPTPNFHQACAPRSLFQCVDNKLVLGALGQLAFKPGQVTLIKQVFAFVSQISIKPVDRGRLGMKPVIDRLVMFGESTTTGKAVEDIPGKPRIVFHLPNLGYFASCTDSALHLGSLESA